MLRRKMYDTLIQWKGTIGHKSLVIKGARQVGKTYIIREFAQNNYGHYLEINFLTDTDYGKLFSQGGTVDDIIFRLSAYPGGEKLVPGSLLFFDEIQECPEARRFLKLFTEDGRYDVIASGSMLGVSESRLGIYKKSGPMTIGVGYEDERIMYALDFEEFLWARGVSDKVISYVKDCIRNRTPIDGPILETLFDHYRMFTVCGGMPEVVDLLVHGDNAGSVTAMGRILSAVREDINKYNNGVDVIKTARCFDSIPSQLGDTNKKFTFSRINEETYGPSTRQKYYDNTEWLRAAGYGNFCYLLKQPVKPLSAHDNLDQYRIYLFDTGMLTHMLGASARMAVLTNDCSFNQGMLTENEVAECLMKSGMNPRYFRKSNGDKRMELDFVIELGTELCVIEVKSGKHREFQSLRKATELYSIDRGIILENGNIFIDENGFEHYPLFAVAFVSEMVRQKEGFDENGFPI